MLVSCLDYGSTLKREATSSSETASDFRRAIYYYNPEDRGILPKDICTADRAVEVDHSTFIKKENITSDLSCKQNPLHPVH